MCAKCATLKTHTWGVNAIVSVWFIYYYFNDEPRLVYVYCVCVFKRQRRFCEYFDVCKNKLAPTGDEIKKTFCFSIRRANKGSREFGIKTNIVICAIVP